MVDVSTPQQIVRSSSNIFYDIIATFVMLGLCENKSFVFLNKMPIKMCEVMLCINIMGFYIICMFLSFPPCRGFIAVAAHIYNVERTAKR